MCLCMTTNIHYFSAFSFDYQYFYHLNVHLICISWLYNETTMKRRNTQLSIDIAILILENRFTSINLTFYIQAYIILYETHSFGHTNTLHTFKTRSIDWYVFHIYNPYTQISIHKYPYKISITNIHTKSTKIILSLIQLNISSHDHVIEHL